MSELGRLYEGLIGLLRALGSRPTCFILADLLPHELQALALRVPHLQREVLPGQAGQSSASAGFLSGLLPLVSSSEGA